MRCRRLPSRLLLAGLVALASHGCGPASQPGAVALAPSEIDDVTRSQPTGPIDLRTSDGVVLRLAALDVRGFVEEPLAFTELHMEFDNPEFDAVDADFELLLPDGAEVTRFAVLAGDRWHEAEVVERALGDARPSLYERIEPALSRDEGNVFRAAVPRIPGRARAKFVVAYAQDLLDETEPYRVRLEGLGTLDRFESHIVVARAAAEPAVLAAGGPRPPAFLPSADPGDSASMPPRRDWKPSTDLRVAPSLLRHTGIRSGRSVVARIEPLTHDHPDPIRSLTILFDTSASRALDFDAKVARLGAIVAELRARIGDDARLRLVAFDQSYDILFAGRFADFEPSHLDLLRERRALGASDLSRVLGFVAAGRGELSNRVLLVTDGAVTAGTQDPATLATEVGKLAAVGIRRLDVLTDVREGRESLIALATALPSRGLVLDGAGDPHTIARRLERGVMSGVSIDVPDARWFYPEQVDGLQAGDEILVHADVDARDELDVWVTGDEVIDRYEVPLIEVEAGLVERARSRAEVDYLIAALERSRGQPKSYRRQFWEQIVEKSREARLLNRYTALEMMADEHDFARAELDPSRLPAILAAGPRVVEQRRRGVPSSVEIAPGEVRLPSEYLPAFEEHVLASRELLLVSAGPDEPEPEPSSVASSSRGDPDESRGRDGAPPRPAGVVTDSPSKRASEAEVGDRHARQVTNRGLGEPVVAPARAPEDAYSGNLLAVMNLLSWGKTQEATRVAWAWREAQPGEVMALVALGEALQAGDDLRQASRAYGSIIDLYPTRADMRRFAGDRLGAIDRFGERLAIDSYLRAREQHPEHPSSHRLLAFALLRAGYQRRAFDVLADGLARDWDQGRFAGVDEVLLEDLGLIGASWIKSDPSVEAEVVARLEGLGTAPAREPSLRFVLTWETGASDVDLHVRDAYGSHASYKNRGLASGGLIYYDATEGYGPEVFAVSGDPTGYPYNLQVHYYATGPLGFGMGKVQIVAHDGAGSVAVDERPFVVSKDRAFLDLGTVDRPSIP